MTNMDPVTADDLRRSARAHARAAKRADKARETRDAVIKRAIVQGRTYAAIAQETGLSVQRVSQIAELNRGRGRPRKPPSGLAVIAAALMLAGMLLMPADAAATVFQANGGRQLPQAQLRVAAAAERVARSFWETRGVHPCPSSEQFVNVTRLGVGDEWAPVAVPWSECVMLLDSRLLHDATVTHRSRMWEIDWTLCAAIVKGYAESADATIDENAVPWDCKHWGRHNGGTADA